MFTGIVQGIGIIKSSEKSRAGLRVVIASDRGSDRAFEPAQPGTSIAVDGCCLTLVSGEVSGEGWTFDVIRESLAKTTLGGLGVGDRVNIERSLRASDDIAGHFVQGHIDGVGEVVEVQDDPEDWRVRVRVPSEFAKYLIPKGSITIAGVSLTLAEVNGDEIVVALIPVTLQETTLGRLEVGHHVNLEMDVLSKAIVSRIEAMGDSRIS